MQATYIATIDPSSFFPTGTNERVVWLERFGVPTSGDCEFTASLRDWASVGARIMADGSVNLSDQYQLRQVLVDAASAIAKEAGAVPPQLPEPVMRSVFAERLAEISRKKSEEEAERAAAALKKAANDEMLARIMALPQAEVAKHLGEDSYPAVTTAAVLKLLGEPIEVVHHLEWNKALYAWADQVRRLYTSEIEAAFERLVLSALTPEQTERFRARVLPVAERDEAVRERLFTPFREFARYQRIDKAKLVHGDDCDEYEIRFSVRDVEDPEMTAEIYSVYKRILAVADACAEGSGPEGQDLEVSYQVREHYSTCDCTGPGHRKLGMRVTMSICGHSYSVEFELGDPNDMTERAGR